MVLFDWANKARAKARREGYKQGYREGYVMHAVADLKGYKAGYAAAKAPVEGILRAHRLRQRSRPNRQDSEGKWRRETVLAERQVRAPCTPSPALPPSPSTLTERSSTLSQSSSRRSAERSLPSASSDLAPDHPRTFGMGMEPGVARLSEFYELDYEQGVWRSSGHIGPVFRPPNSPRCPALAPCSCASRTKGFAWHS